MKKTKPTATCDFHELMGDVIVRIGTGYYATHPVTLLDITSEGELVIREIKKGDITVLPKEFSDNNWIALTSLVLNRSKGELSRFEGRRIYRTRPMKVEGKEKGEITCIAKYLFPETVMLISATDHHMVIQEGEKFEPGCTKILDESWMDPSAWKEAR